MSENTSDTAMGMSDMMSGDNEPSMEDILASIRQIIADDQPQEEAPALIAVQDESVSEPEVIADSANKMADAVSTDDEDDILDLINFVDDTASEAEDPIVSDLTEETFVQETEPSLAHSLMEDLTIAEAPSIAAPTEDVRMEEPADDAIAFDESLDLVMDADASDYVTTTLDTSLMREDVLDIEDILGSTEVAPDESPVEILEEVDLLADIDREEVVLENSRMETIHTQTETVFEDTSLENISEEAVLETQDVLDEDELIVRATADEDIKLVKSLLEDLMDEPADMSIDQDADDVLEDSFFVGDVKPENTAAPESILEEIVEQSIEDELAINEDRIELEAKIPEPQSSNEENALEIIAQNIEIPAHEPLEEPLIVSGNDDDVVDLSPTDMSDKFSLLKTVGTGAALAGAAALATTQGAKPEQSGIEEKLEAADDAVDIEHILETQVSKAEPEPQSRQDTPATEEEVIMAQATPTPSLVDEDTQTQSRDAFASLSTAVQEKTKLEESGPAIGDLVQEALKPMLKEWLDKNLKGIVERAVTKEVKRISAQK